MSRARYRYHPDHGVIPVDEWFRITATESRRSHLSRPYIISDHLDGVQNPVDGKHYDSKSAYYRTVKEAGCEIMGSDPAANRRPTYEPPGGVEEDIKRAIEKLS